MNHWEWPLHLKASWPGCTALACASAMIGTLGFMIGIPEIALAGAVLAVLWTTWGCQAWDQRNRERRHD